jgi:hypothetical protein
VAFPARGSECDCNCLTWVNLWGGKLLNLFGGLNRFF